MLISPGVLLLCCLAFNYIVVVFVIAVAAVFVDAVHAIFIVIDVIGICLG